MSELPGVTPLEKPASALEEGLASRQFIADLFSKYRASLHRYLSRLVPAEDATDLVQEAYYRLLRHGEILPFESAARALLFHTATNLARDFRRQTRSRHADAHVSINKIAELPAPGGLEFLVSDGQTLQRVERAIAELPAESRTIFLLYRYRDLSIEQIASMLGVSPRTVARKFAAALEHLGGILREPG
jgi:RNA polymerase sigma-70 factor (ECF subfamily)